MMIASLVLVASLVSAFIGYIFAVGCGPAYPADRYGMLIGLMLSSAAFVLSLTLAVLGGTMLWGQ